MIDKIEGKVEKLLKVVFGRGKVYLGVLTKWYKGCSAFCGRHVVATRVAAIALLVLTVTGIGLYEFIPREVTLVVDDSKTVVWTSCSTQSRTVKSFLEDAGVEYSVRDDVEPELTEAVTNDMEVVVTKAFNVNVTADGKTQKINTVKERVSSILKKLNIKVNDADIVSPALNAEVKKGEDIVVQRVVTKTRVLKKSLDYDTVTQADSSMTIGKVGVVQKGKLGTKKYYYNVTYIDGKESKAELIKTKVIKKPRAKIIGYGTNISFTTPSGLSYSRAISVKAVSYYFEGNPYGAYGGRCTYGTMAVDPRVIPLGTRCYVVGYGYAVANDVGSGIKGNKVDLYMERYSQCLMWGARYTTVYILN